MSRKLLTTVLIISLLFSVIPGISLASPIGDLPTIDELPAINTIPDPFKFFNPAKDPTGDGYVSSSEEWSARREEIKELVQRYWLGYKWPTKPEDVWGSATVTTDPDTGAITVSNAEITVRNPDRLDENQQPITESFSITINMPTKAQIAAAWGSEDAKVPFVIDIGGTAAFSAANLNPHGYARVTFTSRGFFSSSLTDIYPDSSGANPNREGIYTRLYPYDKDVYEYASGALMAWAWAVSQILNALEQPIEDGSMTFGDLVGLDPTRTVVTGHSRYGKAAMFAAAFDERISICIPSEPGGSGIQSYRYKVEGKIFNFNTYPKANRVYGKTEIPTVSYGQGNSWFPETAAMFVARDNQIPFDSSDIIALVAPRPFFVVSGIDTHWLGNEGGVAAVLAASEVYDYIGKDEIEKGNIAIRVRESNHMFYPRDFCFALAIMDREFKQGDDDKKLMVQDLFPTGTGLGNMSYPAREYDTLSEFNSFPFDINSSYIPWSSPNRYTLWTAQENFLVGYPITITAYSDAPDVDLYLPDKETKIDAASNNDGVFTFELTAEQAVYGRYELRTVGSEKQNRSVFFAAVSLADGLRHAPSKGDEGEENRLIGFSSRLANSPSDPPVVYVGDSETPVSMSFSPERFKVEETTLLEYGIQFHDHLFVRIANEGWDSTKTFKIKNLKFVTIPNYTFEFSLSDIYASAQNNGKQGAANFTKPISWNVERYNNGPAEIWPPWPDTLEERNSGVINRPEAPEPVATDFKATITGLKAVAEGDKTNVVVNFSEPLRKGEYGFGLNIAEKWDTSWNDDGTQVILSVKNEDLVAGVTTGSLIVFRLMDIEGNLIGGPIEKTFELPEQVGLIVTTNANLVKKGQYFDVAASFDKEVSSNAVIVSVSYDGDKFRYAGNLGAGSIEGVTYLNTETEDGNVKLTMMIPDYNAKDLINLRFQAKEDADIVNADNTIDVDVSFVYKDADGEKTIRNVKGSVAFTTSGLPGDTNNDNVIDLLDLSNVIDLFGTQVGDELWNAARFFDFNNNGEIDISDIAYIAKLIK